MNNTATTAAQATFAQELANGSTEQDASVKALMTAMQIAFPAGPSTHAFRQSRKIVKAAMINHYTA